MAPPPGPHNITPISFQGRSSLVTHNDLLRNLPSRQLLDTSNGKFPPAISQLRLSATEHLILRQEARIRVIASTEFSDKQRESMIEGLREVISEENGHIAMYGMMLNK